MKGAEVLLPGRLDTPKDSFISPSKAKELGESGVLRGVNGMPHFDPNWLAMNPYKARGLHVDHGALHKMFYYDAVVNGVYSLTLTEIKRAYWGINEYRNETPIEAEKRKVMEVLFGFEGNTGILGGGFLGLIADLFWAKLYGFSLVELMWDYVTIDGKRYFLPVDAKWRAPWSIYKWIYQGETLVAVTQLVQNTEATKGTSAFSHSFNDTPKSYTERVIPIDKCLLYSNKAANGNPEGISDFRTAYIWTKAKLDKLTRKQIAEEQLYRGIIHVKEEGDERGPYRMIGQNDRIAVKRMLDALKSGKTNRIVEPFGLSIKADYPTYASPNDIEDLEYYDKQIMIGASSSLLGLDSSRGTSKGINDSLTQIAYHAIEGMADDIGAVLNGIPGRSWTGIINKIEKLNWPEGSGRKTTLRHYGISYQDIEKLIDSLAKASQFLIWAPDEYDEKIFRRMARLDWSDKDSITKARAKVSQQNGQLASQSKQGPQIRQNNPKEVPADGNGKAIPKKSDGKDEKPAEKPAK